MIKEDRKRFVCVELLTRVLSYGDSVKDEVREKFRKNFTEGERKLMEYACMPV